MRTLHFSPAARRDLAEIVAYIAEAAGPTIASEVLLRVRAKCGLLAETAGEIGTPRPEIRQGIRSFPVRPHVIFFRYVDQVIRILHERRDVERAIIEW